MPQTKERIRVVVNSNNRVSGTASNFVYHFNATMSRVTEIILEAAQIPFSYYTVNSTNNVLRFNNDADGIVIEPGNYTASSLRAELQTKIDAAFAGQNSAVSYSPITSKLTIYKDVPFVLDAVDGNPNSTAAHMLGFQVDSVSGTSATGDSVINLSGTNYLLMASDYLMKGVHHQTVYSNASYQNVLTTVPVNVSPGDLITFEPELPIRLSSKTTMPVGDDIDFKLLDENCNEIDLNGLYWSAQFLFITE